MATAPHVRITSRAFPVEFAVGSTPQTTFDFDGVFWSAGDLLVYRDGVLVNPVGYTVTGRFEQDGLTVQGGYGGGRITFGTPLTNCDITVDRLVQAIRDSDYSRTSPLPIDSVNSDLDKMTARDQDLLALISSGGGVVSGVSSVNGKFGTVFLDFSDVGASSEMHTHELADITGLAAALNLKANLASPALTGTPTAPTPSAGDNTTKLATTAWVTTALASIGAGVTLATTGTPADLGTASRGVAVTAARADHVHNLPTLTALAAAGVDLANVPDSDFRTKLLAAGALILHASATPSAAAPNSARTNFLLGFDGSDNLTFIDPAGLGGGGVAGVTSVNGASGVVTVSTSSIGAVPQASFRTVDHYGALNGNNIADNKATIDLMLAGSDGQVWWPGTGAQTYYTTNTLASLAGRRMRGASKLRTSSGDNLPADFRYITSHPTKGTGSDVLYDFSGDLRHVDATYALIAAGVRNNDLDAVYFEATVTPQWLRLDNRTGMAGYDANIVSRLSSSVIRVNLSHAGSTGLSNGQNIAVIDGATGSELWRGTISSISGTGATTDVTVSPATLPGSLGSLPRLSLGPRTMHMAAYSQVLHSGRGDAYAHLSRVSTSGALPNGVHHFFDGKTIGNYGGDMALGEAGHYGTFLEHQITSSADAAAIAWVQSLVRGVDTGARSAVWGFMLHKSEGAAPADFAYRVAGNLRSAIDLAGANLSSGNNAAILLAEGHRIHFDTNGFPTTGRGSDPTGIYPTLWSNTPGPTHMSSRPNGELDARGKRIEYVINGSLSAAGYGSMNIRGSTVEFHRSINVYTLAGALAFNLDPTTLGFYIQDGNVGIKRSGNDLHFVTAGASMGSLSSAGEMSVATEYRVNGTKVMGARQSSISNPAADVTSLQVAVISILTAMRAHGQIST